ncbi:MAG: PIN domain-containing protein [Oscillospiraceae bacterium]|nr:PIN domain-containing protein [Oscillospiraceae bacterium]
MPNDIRHYLDANMILRYIVRDDEAQFQIASQIIFNNPVIVTIEVLNEVVYVLKGPYNQNRVDIYNVLTSFFEDTACILQTPDITLKGVELYGANNLDFVDCILAAYHSVENAVIYTFDKKLNRLLNTLII